MYNKFVDDKHKQVVTQTQDEDEVKDKHNVCSSSSSGHRRDKSSTTKTHSLTLIINEGRTPSENRRAVWLLLFLYWPLGLYSGFFSYALQMQLIAIPKTRVSEKELAILLGTFSWGMLPFSFKFLMAPYIDTFYIKKIGKRKTYICFSLILMGIIGIWYSFRLQKDIDNLNIFYLTLVPLTMCYLLIHLDVATDAWSIVLVDKEYLGYARAMKLIGQIVGSLLTYNVFVTLNSVKFCKAYNLVGQNSTQGLISNSQLCFWLGVVFLLLGAFTLIFVKEKKVKVKDIKYCDVISKLKNFWTNKTLFYFLLFILFSVVGYAPINNLLIPKLQRRKMPKSKLALLNLIQNILQIFVGMYIARRLGQDMKNNKNSELTYVSNSLILSAFSYWLNYAVWLYFYRTQNVNISMLLLILVGLIDVYAFVLQYVSYETFNARIANKQMPGTFMNVINGFGNFSREWPKACVFYLNAYVQYKWLMMFGFIYTASFIWCTRSWLLEKQANDELWQFKPEKLELKFVEDMYLEMRNNMSIDSKKVLEITSIDKPRVKRSKKTPGKA